MISLKSAQQELEELSGNMEIPEKSRIYVNFVLLIAFIVVLLSFVIPLFWINGVNPNIGTDSATQIGLQTVPTIINGITTSTSIIVGLSATILGIMIRDLLQNNEKAKFVMLIFMGIAIIYSLLNIYQAYYQLSFVTINSFIQAWKDALSGLVSSFAVLFSIFLVFIYIRVNPKPNRPNTPINPSPNPIPPSQPPSQETKKDDDNKTVNITINME
jgi:hypothetical protein